MDTIASSPLSIDPDAFELVTEPILSVNADGTVHMANAFARGLLESQNSGTCLGQSVWDLHNDNVDGILISSYMHELALTHSPHKFRVELKVSSTAVSAIEWTGIRTARIDNPRVIYFGRFISALELHAEQSDALSATIFSYSQSAILIANRQGIILRMSSAAEKLFGHSQENVKNITSLIPDLSLSDDRLYQSVATPGIFVTHHFSGLRSDNIPFACEIVLGQVQVGAELQIAIFVHNVDNREYNARELITQDDSEFGSPDPYMLNELASMIAHEVKQPLSAALSFIHAARKSLEKAEYIGHEIQILNNAADQVTRAGDIVVNMQKMVRQDAIDPSLEDINALIESAALFTLVDIADLTINTFFYLANEPLYALVDKIQIQQVIHNLIRNAIDAMENSHSRHLKISVSRHKQDIHVSVDDSGAGLNDSDQSLLFTPFATTKDHGMGLGLSICRRIISAHGGTISAKTKETGGAIFTFTLPLSSGLTAKAKT